MRCWLLGGDVPYLSAEESPGRQNYNYPPRTFRVFKKPNLSTADLQGRRWVLFIRRLTCWDGKKTFYLPPTYLDAMNPNLSTSDLLCQQGTLLIPCLLTGSAKNHIFLFANLSGQKETLFIRGQLSMDGNNPCLSTADLLGLRCILFIRRL